MGEKDANILYERIDHRYRVYRFNKIGEQSLGEIRENNGYYFTQSGYDPSELSIEEMKQIIEIMEAMD